MLDVGTCAYAYSQFLDVYAQLSSGAKCFIYVIEPSSPTLVCSVRAAKALTRLRLCAGSSEL